MLVFLIIFVVTEPILVRLLPKVASAHVVGLQRSWQGLSLCLSSLQRAFLAFLLLATWIFRDTLGEILHFQSDIVLHFLQSLRVHKLRERIQLLLVEQSQKVIAKSSHFAVSIGHEILKYSRRMW